MIGTNRTPTYPRDCARDSAAGEQNPATPEQTAADGPKTRSPALTGTEQGRELSKTLKAQPTPTADDNAATHHDLRAITPRNSGGRDSAFDSSRHPQALATSQEHA